MARRAHIVDIVRSPFAKGRDTGALAPIHPVDLYATVLKALIARTSVAGAAIEDVITGCVGQVGEQSGNIARQALLAAGLPESVPGVSLDRKCGSAQQAMDFAAQGVIAGAYDLVLAGGIEMMSRVTMRLNRLGRDFEGDHFRNRYPDGMVRQGISAELIAAEWGLDRPALDAFALRSHRRAAADIPGAKRDIVRIPVPADGGSKTVEADEGIRPDTDAAKLAGLSPAFVDEAMAERYPQIRWAVTPGNASPITDGASAMLIASDDAVKRFGLVPRATVTHFAVVGSDPILMLTGVIPATQKLLARAGLSVGDIDVFEVNEAFASVVLAWLKETGADPDKVNVFGGAIALGHPVGASGGRLTANLLRALEDRGGRLGLQTMCESGGMANATLIERRL